MGHVAMPIEALLAPPDRDGALLRGFAICDAKSHVVPNHPPLTETTMLLVPQRGASPKAPVIEIGETCRICPRDTCAARREPSILSQGL